MNGPGVPLPPAVSGRSAQFFGGQHASVSLAGAPGLASRSEWRLEYRLHDFSPANPASLFTFWSDFSWTSSYTSGGRIYGVSQDVSGGTTWYECDYGNATDLLVRFQRTPLTPGSTSGDRTMAVWRMDSGECDLRQPASGDHVWHGHGDGGSAGHDRHEFNCRRVWRRATTW